MPWRRRIGRVIRELGLEEALDIAMDAELKAQAFYAQAADEIQEPQGRDLLGRLAAFERYHYEQLAKLARSLQDDGRFTGVFKATVATPSFASPGTAPSGTNTPQTVSQGVCRS